MMILLLDDDNDFRTALAENLRYAGHRVVELDTPADGADPARFDDVGLVVADYHLPNQSGLMFVDAFHAAHPRVPVILVTGDPSSYIDDAIGRRPFVRLQRKPMAYQELEAAIESAHLGANI